MKVYLDTCCIQRPLDSKSQIRIVLEAEAILGIIEMCEAQKVELVSSEVLELELDKNTISIRKQHGYAVLSRAGHRVSLNDNIEKRAASFVKQGVKAMDALHLACAEFAKVDFFCTCDARFLTRAKMIENLEVTVLSPLELIQEVE